MSSLLPVQAAPARAAAAPSSAPERRSDVARDTFATSLASARTDTPATRGAARDEETTAARARHSAQQRSQVQLLMLSGAMRFAATRADEPTATLPGGIAMSLPDAPPMEDPMVTDAVIDAATLLPGMPSAPHIGGTMQSLPDAPPAVALPDDLLVSSLPEFAPAEVTPAEGEAIAPAATLTVPDATIAAYQLLNTQPLMRPIALPQADGAPEWTPDAATAEAIAARLALAASAAALLEDQFDAPASLHTDAMSGTVSAGMAAPNATAMQGAAPASDDAPPADAALTAPATDGVTPVRRSAGTAVQTDLSALDPAFREKLEQVMERMRREFGHTVTIVETVRTPERQEQLYAQGRTAPGPVVTWTKNSRHLKGLAADLMVDGGWDSKQGYAQLAIVAREAGLRTLGARDPGHVELPGESGVSDATLEQVLMDMRGGNGDAALTVRGALQRDAEVREERLAQVASVAQVARVAQVADVAQVATVAAVARPGASARESSSAGGESSSPLAVSAPAPLLTGSDVGNAIRTAAPVGAVNMADRISQLMDLQATQAAKPLNSVLLRMQDDAGAEDRIRIDARGAVVGARLGMSDAQQAAALSDSVGELRAALERRGLTTDGVRVQSGTRAIDTTSFTRAAAPVLELAATRAASDAQAQGGSRDQAGRDQQQREAFAREQARSSQRPSPDDQRHRSRREQPETRQ